MESAAADDPSFRGGYLQLSYFLTGEHRVYDTARGAFGRTHPKANFHDGGEGLGAWEVAIRFDYIDLDDGAIRGGKGWNVTFGINWLINPNTTIRFNYIYSQINDIGGAAPVAGRDDGRAHVIGFRIQVDF